MSLAGLLRRSVNRLGSTNRYTDGSGRKLDTNVLPKDMFVQPISNRAYPTTTEHWQLVVANGEPSPYKGRVVVSGGGAIGLTAASLFATRGWHVTVVEKSSDPESEDVSSPHFKKNSVHRVRHTLVTKRAADALGFAGVTLDELRTIGVKVKGALDHPGSFNTFLTRGLTEHHPFAVNMLSVDIIQLRRLLDRQLRVLPSRNCKVFYDHKIVAALPSKKKLVVKALRDFDTVGAPPIEIVENRDETSLSLNLKRMEEAELEGIDYDLVICAEGVNSSLRDYLDVEGFAADREFAVQWFVFKSKTFSREHVHRWLHARKTRVVDLSHQNSAVHTPMCVAFPQIEEDSFALMAYMPLCEMEHLSPDEFRRTYCPDIDGELQRASDSCEPFPTIHCENLFNSVGLPSAVMVGDAAHTCNPFLMQSLALGLEDCAFLLNQVDALSRHFYDAVKQYSRERGVAGDALRETTERCLFYERRKHANPVLRFRNAYTSFMNRVTPTFYNDWFGAAQNTLYSRSIEQMLNGRGYTSYEYVDVQQSKHRGGMLSIGRLFT